MIIRFGFISILIIFAAVSEASPKIYTNMREAIRELGHPIAYGASGEVLKPDMYGSGYHGNGHLTPSDVISMGGIPDKNPKTPSLSLIDHVMNSQDENFKPVSSFRGVTEVPVTPGNQGAVYWADEGGYVFQVAGVPMWNVNQHLEGKLKSITGYNNRFEGELEYAVPSRIPLVCIARWGKVVASANGSLMVRNWDDNHHFEINRCRAFWH